MGASTADNRDITITAVLLVLTLIGGLTVAAVIENAREERNTRSPNGETTTVAGTVSDGASERRSAPARPIEGTTPRDAGAGNPRTPAADTESSGAARSAGWTATRQAVIAVGVIALLILIGDINVTARNDAARAAYATTAMAVSEKRWRGDRTDLKSAGREGLAAARAAAETIQRQNAHAWAMRQVIGRARRGQRATRWRTLAGYAISRILDAVTGRGRAYHESDEPPLTLDELQNHRDAAGHGRDGRERARV